MRQSYSSMATAVLITLASSATTADDALGFQLAADAGYMPAGGLDLQPIADAESPLVANAEFRLSSQLVLEGFYADITPKSLLSETSYNFYTQSFLGTGLVDNGVSTVAGMSVVSTLVERGPVRPFARAGLHHYDLDGGIGQSQHGESLLVGAGANIDLAQGWSATVEWERYSAQDHLDRNLFSASFEYKF